MSFVFSCLLYSLIGSLAGFFVHIFNGIIQARITFNLDYITKTFLNWLKVLMVMSVVTCLIAILVLAIPNSFLEMLDTDTVFLHQLVFYLFTFAAFDFGLENNTQLE